MGAFISSGKRPVIMEVIGPGGKKIGEYVDKKEKIIKEPYHLIEEGVVQ